MVVQEAPSYSTSTHSTADQALLALTLITTWALTTGRRLRADVPPDQLSEAELIDFWADPLLAPETLS